MKIAEIVPILHLDMTTQNQVHMCLAQVAKKSETYLRFFKAQSQLGRTVILDNGAYEGEMLEGLELIQIAREIQPTWIVAPDEPTSSEESDKLYMQFVSMVRTHEPHFYPSIMKILHGDSIDAFETALSRTCPGHALGFSRLTRWELMRTSRAKMIQELAACELHHYIHAFGFLGLAEARELADCGAVDSLDTSAPVWRGLHGHLLTDKWVDYAFDPFSERFWTKQANLNRNLLWAVACDHTNRR